MRHLAKAPTVILCYHRVQAGNSDPFRLCVSPRNFAQHLKLLSRKATFATLDEATTQHDRPRVIVTFDDGYADNLLVAAPIAADLGIPMTVYVTSGMVGSPIGFWWDRLGHLIHQVSNRVVDVQVATSSGPLHVRLTDPRQTQETIAAIRRRLLPCGIDEIDQVLESIAALLGLDPSAPPDARPLSDDELLRLGSYGNVSIGAHTTRHVQLRSMAPSDQFDTVNRSKLDLEAALNREVRHFAYPFGGPESIDAVSILAVREAGFSTATTTVAGSVGSSPDPLRLRRRLVMNWPPHRFRAQMVRWGLI